MSEKLIGVVSHWFGKAEVAGIDLTGRLAVGDTIHVQGHTSDFTQAVKSMQIDRVEVARYGLTIGDVQDVIMTAIGGMNITQTVEGLERYPVNVRYKPELRDDPEKLGRVLVPTPRGEVRVQIPRRPAVVPESGGRRFFLPGHRHAPARPRQRRIWSQYLGCRLFRRYGFWRPPPWSR